MRRSAWGGDTPVTYALIVAFLAVYLFELFGGPGGEALAIQLAWPVTPEWFRTLAFWQPFMFSLVHAVGQPINLLFDGLVVFFFGGSLERSWGSVRFLYFYIVSGLIAGAAVMGLAAAGLAPGAIFMGMVGTWVTMAVAFASINPYATVIFFVFPMQARWLGVLAVGLEFLLANGRYGGPLPALITIGVLTAFAWAFATHRLSLGYWRGPSIKERFARWQQRRRWRKWQREAARIQKPSDLFKR